eukprot:TRINITY_DN7331_c0_g1_i1.p1 TRINITY_DN7331_c0_g1~~TRINITY_DN7331_c0_g1_i1.p1  ORF type:complete len:388 (+),score=79.13 TRINITY_DN7331_c0_g1_i1:471-1634(+)
MRTSALLVLLGLFALPLVFARGPKWHQLDGYTFDQYIRDFDKEYNDHELDMRRSLFETKLKEIHAHNSNPSFTWKQGVNKFTTYTQQELNNLKGYDKTLGFQQAENRKARKITPEVEELMNMPLVNLPTSVDWRQKNVITPVKDQGDCGSCWTFGTTETIESHFALATGFLLELSEQMILDCVPNPNDCGGNGGCGGGTPELIFGTILENTWTGLMSEWFYPYVSHDGKNQPNCLFNASYVESEIDGYQVLPANQYAPVMAALATIGPLVINVDASVWNSYESGVFNGCNQTNPDIDHVVQLVGYGTDPKLGDYWLVRNSWTPFWGENGYIRLARSSNVVCGIDNNPQDGTGCNGAKPQTVWGNFCCLFCESYPTVENNTIPYHNPD